MKYLQNLVHRNNNEIFGVLNKFKNIIKTIMEVFKRYSI